MWSALKTESTFLVFPSIHLCTWLEVIPFPDIIQVNHITPFSFSPFPLFFLCCDPSSSYSYSSNLFLLIVYLLLWFRVYFLTFSAISLFAKSSPSIIDSFNELVLSCLMLLFLLCLVYLWLLLLPPFLFFSYRLFMSVCLCLSTGVNLSFFRQGILFLLFSFSVLSFYLTVFPFLLTLAKNSESQRFSPLHYRTITETKNVHCVNNNNNNNFLINVSKQQINTKSLKAILLLLSHLSYNNKNNKNRFFGVSNDWKLIHSTVQLLAN